VLRYQMQRLVHHMRVRVKTMECYVYSWCPLERSVITVEWLIGSDRQALLVCMCGNVDGTARCHIRKSTDLREGAMALLCNLCVNTKTLVILAEPVLSPYSTSEQFQSSSLITLKSVCYIDMRILCFVCNRLHSTKQSSMPTTTFSTTFRVVQL
jgi:hypothetical protein